MPPRPLVTGALILALLLAPAGSQAAVRTAPFDHGEVCLSYPNIGYGTGACITDPSNLLPLYRTPPSGSCLLYGPSYQCTVYYYGPPVAVPNPGYTLATPARIGFLTVGIIASPYVYHANSAASSVFSPSTGSYSATADIEPLIPPLSGFTLCLVVVEHDPYPFSLRPTTRLTSDCITQSDPIRDLATSGSSTVGFTLRFAVILTKTSNEGLAAFEVRSISY